MPLCVRMSVSPCVQLKSAVTFEGGKGSLPNFKERPNFLQVIFWWMNQAAGPTGSGSDPEKGGFC